MTTPTPSPYRCGAVALVGQPNAGKSTLLNRLLGQKLAIVSSKPQTTRHRLVGVYTDDRLQAILLDTPGIHTSWTELNQVMVQRAMASLDEADVVCWLGDMVALGGRAKAGVPVLDETDARIAEALRRSGKPVLFVANKLDTIEKTLLLPVIDAVRAAVPLTEAIPLSALTGDHVGDLLDALARHLPEGPRQHDPDAWTPLSERFLAEEIIREKIFLNTEQEIPYATHVTVLTFDEAEREAKGLVKIQADIVVERPSQKAIVIGKGGAMLKEIGTQARKDLVTLLDCRVYLELFVKVERDWTRTAGGLRRVGYRDPS
jgi:GTP-binding protein Era